jgi:hypothetical protein
VTLFSPFALRTRARARIIIIRMRNAFELVVGALEALKEHEEDGARSKQDTVEAARRHLCLIMTALLTQPMHEYAAAPWLHAATSSSSAG